MKYLALTALALSGISFSITALAQDPVKQPIPEISEEAYKKLVEDKDAAETLYRQQNAKEVTVAPVKEPITQDEAFKRDVALVEDYLRNLTTAKARFVQTTHDGTQLVGTFYLQRPGRLRFEYDDPIKDFVVADGTFIYFYDSELGEQTNAPIGQTLADFFLRKDINLNSDLIVKSIKRKGGYMQVEIIQKDDPEGGSLTFAFKENSGQRNPLNLSKWRIVDAQGLITEVELFHMKTGVKHKDNLFVYIDPKRGTEQNLNE